MNVRQSRAALGLALSLGAIQVFARTQVQQPPTPGQTIQASAHDRMFLARASECNLSEIAAAKIAVDKDISAGARSFAQMLIENHTRAQEEVQKLAGAASIVVPAEPDTKHMTKASKLNSLTGAAFESRFLDEQKRDHAEAILMFKKEMREGSDLSIRAFAEKTLPTLKRHAEMVKQLSMNAGQPTAR